MADISIEGILPFVYKLFGKKNVVGSTEKAVAGQVLFLMSMSAD